MKRACEIDECVKIINDMFAEWDKFPLNFEDKNLRENEKKRKEIEKAYWPKIVDAYNRYKAEHPEEFADKKTE